MSNHLLLEGQAVEQDPLLEQAERNAEEIRDLREQLREARADIAEAKRQGARSVGALRKQLTPLYQALQAVFGEMAQIDGADSTAPSQVGNPKWDFWKKRYPGRIADAIDLLLVQGDMNSKQLCAALKCDPRTLAKSVIYQLNGAGLLIKNGGRFSLKELK